VHLSPLEKSLGAEGLNLYFSMWWWLLRLWTKTKRLKKKLNIKTTNTKHGDSAAC
jgi:hypothetical protein